MMSKTRTHKPQPSTTPVPDGGDPANRPPTSPGEYREIPVSQLAVNPRNGRKVLRGIDELAQTIRDVGVIEPLIVRPRTNDTFQVCFGHRRFAAAQQANLTEVPCLIRDLDDVQVLKEGLIENVHRDDLTYLEEAEQLAELMELRAFTVAELAADLGQSPTHVKNRLSLLTLPDKARAALDAGVITYSTTLDLTEIADYPDVITDLIDEHDGVDTEQLQEAVRRVTIERECVRLREEAAVRGWRLIEDGEPRSLGYVYLSELDLTPGQLRNHRRQSCHAVYLEIALGRPRLTELCSTPARHRPTAPTASDPIVRRTAPDSDPAAGVSGGDQPGPDADPERWAKAEAAQARQLEREERERREQEMTKNRKRVATMRRTFLSGLVGKRTPKRAEVMVFIYEAILEKASQTTMAWVGRLLGVEAVTTRYGTTNWHAPVVAYAAQSSDQMLKTVLLVTAHWAEEHVNQYTKTYDAAVVRYLELLGTIGYVPDPYETEQIAYSREADQAEADRRDGESSLEPDEDPSEPVGDEAESAANGTNEGDVQEAGEQLGEVTATEPKDDDPAAAAVPE